MDKDTDTSQYYHAGRIAKSLGWTQTKIAEGLQISRPAAYRLLHGTPSINKVRQLADLLGVNIKDFFADSRKM